MFFVVKITFVWYHLYQVALKVCIHAFKSWQIFPRVINILDNIGCVQNCWETKQAHPLGKLNLLTTALVPPLTTATSGNSMNSCLENKFFLQFYLDLFLVEILPSDFLLLA